jgi:hypothetical protein
VLLKCFDSKADRWLVGQMRDAARHAVSRLILVPDSGAIIALMSIVNFALRMPNTSHVVAMLVTFLGSTAILSMPTEIKCCIGRSRPLHKADISAISAPS